MPYGEPGDSMIRTALAAQDAAVVDVNRPQEETTDEWMLKEAFRYTMQNKYLAARAAAPARPVRPQRAIHLMEMRAAAAARGYDNDAGAQMIAKLSAEVLDGLIARGAGAQTFGTGGGDLYEKQQLR
jgi:hypothetical protein